MKKPNLFMLVATDFTALSFNSELFSYGVVGLVGLFITVSFFIAFFTI